MTYLTSVTYCSSSQSPPPEVSLPILVFIIEATTQSWLDDLTTAGYDSSSIEPSSVLFTSETAPSPSPAATDSSNSAAVIGSAAGAALLVVAGAFFLYFSKKRGVQRRLSERGDGGGGGGEGDVIVLSSIPETSEYDEEDEEVSSLNSEDEKESWEHEFSVGNTRYVTTKNKNKMLAYTTDDLEEQSFADLDVLAARVSAARASPTLSDISDLDHFAQRKWGIN